MSDSTILQALEIDPDHVTDYLKFRDKNSRDADTLVIKSTYGQSRNGWFQSASGKLISDAGLSNSLRFISNERSSLTRVTGDEVVDFAVTGNFRPAIASEDREAWSQSPRWGYRRDFTILLPGDIPALSIEVERLWHFCVDNICQHPLLNDGSYDSPEELLSNLQFFSNLGDSGYGDEGDNSGFYFFVLHALRSLLAEAPSNNWAVIYLTEEYVRIIEDAHTVA